MSFDWQGEADRSWQERSPWARSRTGGRRRAANVPRQGQRGRAGIGRNSETWPRTQHPRTVVCLPGIIASYSTGMHRPDPPLRTSERFRICDTYVVSDAEMTRW